MPRWRHRIVLDYCTVTVIVLAIECVVLCFLRILTGNEQYMKHNLINLLFKYHHFYIW